MGRFRPWFDWRGMVRLTVLGVGLSFAGAASAGVTFGYQFGSPQWRWDADDSRRVYAPGEGTIERSLVGGLRYSVEGGSLADFFARFTWDIAPSENAFHQAFENAFDHWRATDPATRLGTAVTFTEDFGTAVNEGNSASPGFGNLRLGSEIDIFATPLAAGSGFAQVSAFGAVGVELTSGVANYNGNFAISGADVHLSTSQFSVESFELLLTHELGHALGLADAELADGANVFLDDNYDGTNSATASATLTNSWAARIDPFDPDNLSAAGLQLYKVANSDPGLDAPGARILMESNDAGELPAMLHADDYAMRQFLYPMVLSAQAGDTDGDGDVDLSDLNNVRNNFGGAGAGDTSPFDGDVDLDDLNAVRNNFGSSPAVAVPEASALALASLGVGSLFSVLVPFRRGTRGK